MPKIRPMLGKVNAVIVQGCIPKKVAETGEGGMGKHQLARGIVQHGQTSLPMPPQMGCTHRSGNPE